MALYCNNAKFFSLSFKLTFCATENIVIVKHTRASVYILFIETICSVDLLWIAITASATFCCLLQNYYLLQIAQLRVYCKCVLHMRTVYNNMAMTIIYKCKRMFDANIHRMMSERNRNTNVYIMLQLMF